MAYIDDEASAADGDVVELFEFEGPQISYRYTSSAAAFVYLGNSYAPAPGLTRSALGDGTPADAKALVVKLRCSEAVVIDYGFGTPPRSLRLRAHRVQRNSGAAYTIWDGAVVAISPKGGMADLRSVSQLGLRLSTQVPSITVQKQCQHFLYDDRCRVNRATYLIPSTVVSVSGKSVVLSTVGLAPDGWLQNGEIIRIADGERETIVRQVGAVIELLGPFRLLAPSDVVQLYPGCDHLIYSDCGDKFDNIKNFGGHANVPNSNPFVTAIRLLRR